MVYRPRMKEYICHLLFSLVLFLGCGAVLIIGFLVIIWNIIKLLLVRCQTCHRYLYTLCAARYATKELFIKESRLVWVSLGYESFPNGANDTFLLLQCLRNQVIMLLI